MTLFSGRATDDLVRLWVVGAWLSGFALLVLHGLQFSALVPTLAGSRWVMEWPHTLHLWMLESLAWLTLFITLMGICRGSAWQRNWSRKSANGRTGLLVAALVSVEVLFMVGFWLTWPHGVDELGWLRAFFFLGAEWRPAALFSAAQLWLAALLCWKCLQFEGHRAWLMAAGLCLYLGLDEWFSLHEALGHWAGQTAWVRGMRNATGSPVSGFYTWQLVFLPAVALVGAWLLVAFRRITTSPELAVLCAGVMVFLGGALGVESVESHSLAADPGWWQTRRAHVVLLIEEGMEMLGVTAVVAVLARRHWARTAPKPVQPLQS